MGEYATKFHPDIDLDEFERRLRAAAPAPKTPRPQESDPLAELARLVGGDKMAGREDPFEALFRAQKAIREGHPEAEPEPLHAPHESYVDESQAYPAQDHHYAEAPRQEAAAQFAAEPLPYGDSQPDWNAAAESQAADPGSWTGGYEEGAPQAPTPFAPRRKVAYGMAAVLLAGVAGIGVTLAWRAAHGPHHVVTIEADKGPAKIRAPKKVNPDFKDNQALFENNDSAKGAKIVGRAEQPTDLSAIAKATKPGAAASVPTPVPPSPSAAPTRKASSRDAFFPAPRKVKTFAVRADGTVIDSSTTPNAAPSTPSAPPVDRTLPTMATGRFPATELPAPAASKPAAHEAKSTSRVVAATSAAAPKTPAKPIRVARRAVEAQQVGGTGGYAVQFAGAPSEADARAAARRLDAKYSSALGGRRLTTMKAVVHGKTYYRVRAVNLTKEAAISMCAAVKGRGGVCFVAHD